MMGVTWKVLLALVIFLDELVFKTAASDCLSGDWRLDETGGRCLRLSDIRRGYFPADEDCRARGGRLFTPDDTSDLDALERLFGSSGRFDTYWTEYLFVRQGQGYRVFDGRGAEVELAACGRCPASLGDQSPPLATAEGTRLCARVSTNTSVTWGITDCAEEHYYACYYSNVAEDLQLATRDIAAIAVGAFILVCFFVTLAIDFYLHVKRERRNYLDNTTVIDPDQDEKKLSPLDFSVSNFGSNVDLVPTTVSLSHV